MVPAPLQRKVRVPLSRHTKWMPETSVTPTSPLAQEHDVLSEVLGGRCASTSWTARTCLVLSAWRGDINQSKRPSDRQSPRLPSRRSLSGGVSCPLIQRYLAGQLAQDAAIPKERRDAKEDKSSKPKAKSRRRRPPSWHWRSGGLCRDTFCLFLLPRFSEVEGPLHRQHLSAHRGPHGAQRTGRRSSRSSRHRAVAGDTFGTDTEAHRVIGNPLHIVQETFKDEGNRFATPITRRASTKEAFLYADKCQLMRSDARNHRVPLASRRWFCNLPSTRRT